MPSPERLAAYLAAGVGTSLLATAGADAAVVAINLGPSGFNLQGVNGGVAYSTYRTVSNFPVSGQAMRVVNGVSGLIGLGSTGAGYLEFAINGVHYADPRTFASNASISNAGTVWSNDPNRTGFLVNAGGSYSRASFGAGNYLGFRFSTVYGGPDYYFGYIEATWDSTTQTFQLFSAAYESTANVGITTPAAVPAPSALALLALGGGAFRRARQRAA